MKPSLAKFFDLWSFKILDKATEGLVFESLVVLALSVHGGLQAAD